MIKLKKCLDGGFRDENDRLVNGKLDVESLMQEDKSLDDFLLDWDEEFAPLEFLFESTSGDEVLGRLLARGNVQLAKGEPKTGKSAFGLLLITAALKGEFLGIKSLQGAMKVLWVDTEQDEQTVRDKVCKVWEMADVPSDKERLHVLSLRKESVNEQRLVWLLDAVRKYRPDFVFVDGVVDLCEDFNDNKESATVVFKLLRAAEELNCAMLCVIHSNKQNNEARGHLGAILQQKCTEMYLLEKLGIEGNVRVNQQASRFGKVSDITFRIGDGFALLPADATWSGVNEKKEGRTGKNRR